ncbi:MAG: hypothetical protein M3N95_09950 [Actinomycetota bacterium]|nr:hypothetical protein [Actinomycetota bacterium]
MADLIIKTGDLLQIPVTPPTIVPVLLAPIPLTGSSRDVFVADMPACLLGDELPLELREPLPYTSPPFVTPGVGTLAITLAPVDRSQLCRNGKPFLLRGQRFVARFSVMTPAQQPTPAGPVPDPLMTKVWPAGFVTTNTNVRSG